ncbi:hypothetical protein CEP51_011555 [Fusarium floridanum]|uniref:NmrA-like domain-containing protein n=1 Tax=Fusarium floridanum TaxID=1325733 RepID=A0A428RAD0_9HYPO|nr:hypothetical protein CEP51_011555 [Fusarium floridanum]
MSPLVAVAGGTGNLGRTIVEGIIADAKFEVVILARKIVTVDYTSVEALTRVLEDNKVHTVISVLNTMGDGAEPELHLITAADRAATTKRYIPSIWGGKYTEELATHFPIAKDKLEAIAIVFKVDWFTGYFADYYVAPHIKTYMTILHAVVDVTNNRATIPGSGDMPVAFTHTLDIAKLVAASLTLPKWEPETYMIGDKLTFNDLVALAERVKGVKFKVTYDSVHALKAGTVSELPSHPEIYPFFPKDRVQGLLATSGLMFEDGIYNLKPKRTIDQAFPELKVRNMKALMEEAWKGNVGEVACMMVLHRQPPQGKMSPQDTLIIRTALQICCRISRSSILALPPQIQRQRGRKKNKEDEQKEPDEYTQDHPNIIFHHQ